MYIKFNDSKSLIECTVSLEDNVATMKFANDVVVDTSGFKLYLDKNGEYDIGGDSYLYFTTIFRNDEETRKYNGYQLSDDGEIYEEPKDNHALISEEESIEELQERKIYEMNMEQQKFIQSGVDVILTNGEIERFTLSEHEQVFLLALQSMILLGENKIPWHNSDESEHCKFYSNADMSLIISNVMNHISYHITYFRDLRIYIRSMREKYKIESVFYGMEIPIEFQSEPLALMNN